jgi:O-Antigen ligase
VSTLPSHHTFAGARIALLALGLVAACAAGTGAAQHELFDRPSDLKYAVTVIVPLLAVSVIASREPVTRSAFLLIVLAPFGGFDSTISGVQVPLIAPLCVGAVLVAMLAPGELTRMRMNPVPLALAAVLLAVPLLTGSSPAHYLGLLATLGAAGFVAARACSRPSGTSIVLAGLVTSAVVQASIELWQLRTGHALNLYGSAGAPVLGRDYFYQFEDVFRPSAALYDPISLGNLLAIALPAAVALALRASSPWVKLAWAGSGLWIMLGLVLTLSRMSWIAGVVAVVVVVALQERGRLVAATAIAASVVIVLMAALVVDGSSLGKRLDSVIAPTSTKTANHVEDRTRTRIWAATGDIIAQHPIAGVGFGELHRDLAGNYPDSRPGVHAHSTYLQVLGEGGALAGLAFAMVLAAAVVTVARAVRRRVPHAVALAGSLVATLTCWSTDYTVRYLAVAATFATVFGAISALRYAPGERDLAGT